MHHNNWLLFSFATYYYFMTSGFCSLEYSWLCNNCYFFWCILLYFARLDLTFSSICFVLYLFFWRLFSHFLYFFFIFIWNKGKNIVKGTTQISGHSLKLHFYMFERSQSKHNNLNCHDFFWNIFHQCKIYMYKIWYNSKMFVHVESIQTSKMDSF